MLTLCEFQTEHTSTSDEKPRRIVASRRARPVPETGERLPDAVAAEVSPGQDYAVPRALQLQSIHVARSRTRTGILLAKLITNMEICDEYYRQSAKSKRNVR